MRPRVVLSLTLLAAGGWLLVSRARAAQQSGLENMPMATEDRVKLPGWWPTKGTGSREQFAGPDSCSPCHARRAASQKTTPMAHASVEAADSDILRSHERLSFQLGPYHYEIVSGAKDNLYSVRQGENSLSVKLAWALGYDEVGQTYLYTQHGSFYESRLSYFRSEQGLDITTGHSRSVPPGIADAAGRFLDANETQHCFGCHATASTIGNRLDLGHLIPGVTCEACHGPGLQHVAAMQAEDLEGGKELIFDPARLSPVGSVEFCGACHRTKWDVALSRVSGIFTVRFQPYRLETSKCWGQRGDSRLTCVACHDPHKPLVHDLASYDERCLQCHATSKNTNQPDRMVVACPTSTNNCVMCHMPKYDLPEMHAPFTDHRIRIVRKGDPFPG